FLFDLKKKSHQANRIFLAAQSLIRLSYVIWLAPCGASFVLFSSTNDAKGEGVEERNQKFLEKNERSEYEPKANISIYVLYSVCLNFYLLLNLSYLLNQHHVHFGFYFRLSLWKFH